MPLPWMAAFGSMDGEPLPAGPGESGSYGDDNAESLGSAIVLGVSSGCPPANMTTPRTTTRTTPPMASAMIIPALLPPLPAGGVVSGGVKAGGALVGPYDPGVPPG
ncbi:MAG: hypothetical protein ACRD0P_26490 [Stackebrandtia sp.]